MNPRTTLVLAIVAALLGGFVYLYEIEGESTRESAAENERKIHRGLEAAELEAIELTTRDGVAARFERRDERWTLVSPVVGPADAAAVDGIAEALANLVREGEVPEAGALDQYGLGEGARIVRFEVGGEARGIRIGGDTPVGGHRYVARLADDEVAYVARYRTNAFDRDLADLRERRIFGFEVGDVEAIDLRWPGAGVTLVRAEEGWSLVEPVEDRADETTVRELLSDLAFLRASGFVDEPDEAVRAALSEPPLEIRLTLADGDSGSGPRTIEAVIGGHAAGDRLARGPSGEVYTIDSERLEDFGRTISAYRYKTLSEFEVSAARRVRLRFEEEGVVTEVDARLADGGWSSEEPAVDPDRISDLVRELAGLRAIEIVADEMGPAELAAFGLSPPIASIRIEDRSAGDGSEEETSVLAEVALGVLDIDRGLYAQRVGTSAVYLLDVDVAEEVPISAAAFAARFALQDEAGGDVGEEIELEPEALDPDPLVGDPVVD